MTRAIIWSFVGTHMSLICELQDFSQARSLSTTPEVQYAMWVHTGIEGSK